MSKQRVIAFGMHETELDAANYALSEPVRSESYVIGEIEEAEIAALEQQGLVVERVEPSAGLPETPAVARRGVAAAGGGGWSQPPRTRCPTPSPGWRRSG